MTPRNPLSLTNHPLTSYIVVESGNIGRHNFVIFEILRLSSSSWTKPKTGQSSWIKCFLANPAPVPKDFSNLTALLNSRHSPPSKTMFAEPFSTAVLSRNLLEAFFQPKELFEPLQGALRWASENEEKTKPMQNFLPFSQLLWFEVPEKLQREWLIYCTSKSQIHIPFCPPPSRQPC